MKDRPRHTTEQLQQRNRELSILNAIAQALNREIDLTSALQTVLAQVADLLDLDTGWIWLLREESGDSYLAASLNLPSGLVNKPHQMEGSCYCLDTYRSGDLSGAANVNVVKCSRLSNLVDGADGLRYHSSIPLYAHGKKLGVLNVASTDWRELSSADLQLLYTIGDMLSIAVERARLFDQREQIGAVEERNRLAREIHDTVAQGLAGIVMQLETAEALLETASKTAAARQSISKALDLTRVNLNEVRRSVLDLRATPLEGQTLPEALEKLIEELQHDPGLSISYHISEASQPLPVRIESGIFRIAQEALTNIARHAGAQLVTISLIIDKEWVTLIIKDDGVGFDPTANPAGHFGLIGIRERVKLLDGTLKLYTAPGEGTELVVNITHTDERKRHDV